MRARRSCATMMTPEVSLSSRCTIPGRGSSAAKPCASPAAVEEQRVHQRSRGIAAARVHDHALRLVDHDHIIVLEQDGERDVLRHDIRVRRRSA